MSEYKGHKNLEIASEARNFNHWMYGEIYHSLKGSILEIGSGLGTFSEKIISDFPNSFVTLTDISPTYLNMLREKFHQKNVSINKLDLNLREDYEKNGYEKFDSIVALNVLEHVENDEFALEQLYKMLRKDGNLVILVPCHKFLFNMIDSSIGHYRRYTKKELEYKVRKARFEIIRMFYFNMVGIIGWYVNGNLCKKSQVNQSAFKIYDKIVPIMRLAEKITCKKIGISLICYLHKQ